MFKIFNLQIKKELIILLFLFCFSLSLRINSLDQVGRTWDEPQYIEQGYKLIELIKKGDFNNSYFYTTYDHPPLVKYLYGITAHFDLKKIVNNNPIFNYDYTFSRLLSAIMFSLGVVVVVLIGWRVSTFNVGIISGLILSMLPFSLGLSQLVTTESLKILMYPLAIYAYILLLDKLTLKRTIVTGIITGLALQAKQTDFILIFILGISFFIRYKQAKSKNKDSAKNIVLVVLSIILISGITFIAIWPQMIFHLREILLINQQLWNVHFSTKIWQLTLSPPEVFFGRVMLTPIFYYVIYFFITIPLLVIVSFIYGFTELLKNKKIEYLVLALWFLLPFSLSIYSWRQHGLRYIIEIYPALALIAAIGLDKISKITLKENYKKSLFFTLFFVYLFANIIYIKPYYLDYFNELVGGTTTVSKYNQFQIGWWGEGEKEASNYVINNSIKNSTVGLALSPEHTFPKSSDLRYFEYKSNTKYDFVIVNQYHIIRDGFKDNEIKKKYKLIHRVKAGGATLVYVYKFLNE